MRLTKRSVDAISFSDSGIKFYFDDQLPGFGVRVSRSKKAYIVQGRVAGRSRRISLGPHGVITAEEARSRAIVQLAEMSKGVDPREAKEAAEKKTALDNLTLLGAMEQYITDKVAAGKLKPRSEASIRRHFEQPKRRSEKPALHWRDWADRPIAQITRDMVKDRYLQLVETSPAQANQAWRNLKAIYNYARRKHRGPEGEYLLRENPCEVVTDLGLLAVVHGRTTRIPQDRVRAVWQHLKESREDMAATKIARTSADIAAFLLLTGLRWSMAAELTADRVDLKAQRWVLPAELNKTGKTRTFPLSDQAAEILAARDVCEGYMFAGRVEGRHISDARLVFEQISEIAGLPITQHDLRRTYSSIASSLNIQRHVYQYLIGHLPNDVTGVSYEETENLGFYAADAQKVADWITSCSG